MGQPVPPPRPDHRASRRLAILLDDLVRIPGTRQGIGLDALLGLIPGFGDLLGSGISGERERGQDVADGVVTLVLLGG